MCNAFDAFFAIENARYPMKRKENQCTCNQATTDFCVLLSLESTAKMLPAKCINMKRGRNTSGIETITVRKKATIKYRYFQMTNLAQDNICENDKKQHHTQDGDHKAAGNRHGLMAKDKHETQIA